MRGKYCLYCGNKLPQDGDFCPDCGEKIFNGQIDASKGYLTHCRVRLPLDASFCPICGSKIIVEEEEETLEEDASDNVDIDKGEGMFANVGIRIQNFASFFFVINLVISIGLAYLTYSFVNINSRGDEKILPSVIAFIIMFIIGWLFSLLLYGYGKMIDYQKRILEELLKKNGEVESKKKQSEEY